jgi:hypothetical protein
MTPWYATNARDLLEARRHGFAPAGPVVVAMVGGDFSDVADVTLYVRPDMPVDRVDWRMLVNVDVWLWAGQEAALGWLLATTSRIAHARPRDLVLRFEEQDEIHDLEVGWGTHIAAVANLPPQDHFDWVPINCSGSRLGSRLRQALIATHPRWTRL